MPNANHAGKLGALGEWTVVPIMEGDKADQAGLASPGRVKESSERAKRYLRDVKHWYWLGP